MEKQPRSHTHEIPPDLTVEEFQHILTSFPLVDESVKIQTLNTYRELMKLGEFVQSS